MVTKTTQFLEPIPFVYGRFRNLFRNKRLPIHVFGTSSSGNSIYFKNLNVLIDLGLPYVRYSNYDKNFFNQVDYLFLTHEHGDHLNVATLLKVLKTHDNVKIVLSERMKQLLKSNDAPKAIKQKQQELLFYLNVCYKRFITAETCTLVNRSKKEMLFKPHTTKHGDILNMAIELRCPEINLHMLYATDLDNLEQTQGNGYVTGLPHYENDPFNIILLEANYDADILNEHLRIYPFDAHAKGSLRHISEQEAFRYVERYLDDDGLFIPLHCSNVFGTLTQETVTNKQHLKK